MQPIVPLMSNGLGNQMSCIAGAFEFQAACLAKGDHRQVLLDSWNVLRGKNKHEASTHVPAAIQFWPAVPSLPRDADVRRRVPVHTMGIFRALRVDSVKSALLGLDWRDPGTAIEYRGIAHHHFATEDTLRETVSRHAVIPPLSAPLETLAGGLVSLEGALFLHVRRGDYHSNLVLREMFSVDLYKQYYGNALEHFAKEIAVGSHVLVCSDDIAWCTANLPARYPQVPRSAWVFSSAARADDTLVLMATCGLGGITANSSLSWWGMVLGKYKGDEQRKYVTPSHFTRALWPLSARKDARTLRPLGVLTENTGDRDVSVIPLAALAIIVIAVFAIRQAWQRYSSGSAKAPPPPL